jgi:hypothetical protein
VQVQELLSRFSRVEVCYWNSVLFPLAALIRLSRRHAPARVQAGAVASTVDRLFGSILEVENHCLVRGWSLPFGLSLVACARR